MVQPQTKRFQQCDEQANDGRKFPIVFSELDHFRLKLDGIQIEHIETDHRGTP
ncbi:MAG: hypothetical protein ACREXM_19965 [Gammaproteobacteria bacterium]